MQYLHSKYTLDKPVPKNIAIFLKEKAGEFANNYVFNYYDKKENTFIGITWGQFYRDILSYVSYLTQLGFKKGEKMVIFSPNCYEMLVTELAVMAAGGVAVPIFAFFKKDTANMLIDFCDAQYLTIHGEFQYLQFTKHPGLKKIICFDKVLALHKSHENIIPFDAFINSGYIGNEEEILDFSADKDTVCLNMYTSGTMGIPKCVQLTHQNILSQQVAMSYLWNITPGDRFLSYLPWHHSFGGIFELFAALYNGAPYYLEPSYGKDITSIIQSWKKIFPTVFFSVPKIHKSLVEFMYEDPAFEKELFHSGLKFIFTAAAPLPSNIANEYLSRNVKIMEGWGLTETSPCCTIAVSEKERQEGVVGFPIPGVEIRLDEDNEIQVKGPNVLKGYYKNEEANKEIFTKDGWFRTGDIGEITPKGLKLISRKDRIFKLSNGEKVIPSDIEKLIEGKCCYIAYTLVYGSGKEYPVALLFPNKKMLEHPNYEHTPNEGCFCPRTLDELKKCLSGCLCQTNDSIKQKFSKIKVAAIIDSELSIEDGTLTPSLKPSPKTIIQKYADKIEKLYNNKLPSDNDLYVIVLDNHLKNSFLYGGN